MSEEKASHSTLRRSIKDCPCLDQQILLSTKSLSAAGHG